MKKALFTAVLLAALPAAAMADSLDYSYLEAGYNNTHVKGAGDADGGYVKGSYGFKAVDGLYTFGEAGRVSTHGIDVDTYDVGVGYHHALSRRVDLLGEAAWIREDVKHFGHADGYRLGVGVKAQLMDSLHAGLKANYYDGSDLLSQWSAEGEVQYKFTPNWSAVGGVEYFDKSEATNYKVGVRYSF